MAVRIRLHRAGSTHRPFYRVVVADSRSPRDGRFIETVGYYDPLPETTVLKIDTDRVNEWIGKGAKPSDTVRTLMKNAASFTTAEAVAEKAKAKRAAAVEEAGRMAPPKKVKEPKADAKPAGKARGGGPGEAGTEAGAETGGGPEGRGQARAETGGGPEGRGQARAETGGGPEGGSQAGRRGRKPMRPPRPTLPRATGRGGGTCGT